MPNSGLVLNPDLPKTLRIDEGECYVRTEGTKGEYGVYGHGQGRQQALPHEAPLASFCNLSALRRWSSATTSPMPSSSSGRSISSSARWTNDALRRPALRLWNWLDAIIRVVIVVTRDDDRGHVPHLRRAQGRRPLPAAPRPDRDRPRRPLQASPTPSSSSLKEDIRPTNADRWVFELAPYATFIPVFLVLLALPFAEDWGVRNLGLGLFFVFAILGLNIVGIMMAGLGSGNKYALLGGVRAAAQMISYEIPLVISLLCRRDGRAGHGWQRDRHAQPERHRRLQEDRPFILLQPLAFLIFFTAMLSELHRAPFDIPVAESEIVGGYFVEYSGIRWSMFQLTEYASMWGFSVFGSVVFLGGWAFPFGEDWGWGWQLATHDGEEPRVHPRHLLGAHHRPAPPHRPAHELLLEGPPSDVHRPDAHERRHPRL
jgi:hypothetical protein